MKKIFFNTKTILIAVLVFGFFGTQKAVAQQDAQFSMYMFNPLSYNPAYAGSRDALSVSLLGRNQWVNIDGAPVTGTFSLHTPLKNNAIGLGLSVIQDEIGPSKNTAIYGDVSYKFKVSKNSRLAFGLKVGLDMYSANFTGLRVVDGSDIQYTTPISGQLMPNFGFGAYWYSKKSYLGLTMPKLVRNEFEGITKDGVQSIQDRHLFLTAGHTIKINSVVDFIPSVLVKAVIDAPLSVDVNANFFFYEKLWVGAGYRFGDSFTANLVYHFTPQFRAGYAYDYTLSDMGNYNTGTHEVMINYDLDFEGNGFKTPRRF
jgi:type IX secretion system PorP/SprF family membrane protein